MLYNEERELMKKYGYTINDECFGDNDDYRNLFDLYIGSKEHNELVEKYIAPVKHQEFIRDLTKHCQKNTEVYNKIVELARVLSGETSGEKFENQFDLLFDSLIEVINKGE